MLLEPVSGGLSPPRRAEGRPRTALQSESVREYSPAFSSPSDAWCPGSADQHTLWKNRVELKNIILVFSVENKSISRCAGFTNVALKELHTQLCRAWNFRGERTPVDCWLNAMQHPKTAN